MSFGLFVIAVISAVKRDAVNYIRRLETHFHAQIRPAPTVLG